MRRPKWPTCYSRLNSVHIYIYTYITYTYIACSLALGTFGIRRERSAPTARGRRAGRDGELAAPGLCAHGAAALLAAAAAPHGRPALLRDRQGALAIFAMDSRSEHISQSV